MWVVHIEESVGLAGDFHSRDIPHDRATHLWWLEPEREAIVLGSTQSEDVIDVDACQRSGVDIVRRRSGGGVVLLTPSEVAWLDVIIPVEHPLWDRDITTSSFWLGEAWIESLESMGIEGLGQHRGGLERSALSDLICFAGRGPGEVFLGEGPKVVGISQRRTRTHARFQCAVSITWNPLRLLELLNEPRPDPSRVTNAGSVITVDRQQLIERTTAAIVRRLTARD
jgi:lipoate-protein ligase A